jgi:PTEN induced putative kinase 1
MHANGRLVAGKAIAKGCSAVVYAAKLKKAQPEPVSQGDQKEFPFAIKMMFNYHAESNAFTILRAMQR